MKAPLRTKSIGTKVSEEEFAALEATARAADMTLSEWVRAVLLALRTLLLNLFFRASKGEAIPEPEMRALIERADGAKMQRAQERLETAQQDAARKESEKAEDLGNCREPDIHFASSLGNVLFLRVAPRRRRSNAGDRNCWSGGLPKTASWPSWPTIARRIAAANRPRPLLPPRQILQPCSRTIQWA
jgi:hypothetical protein